MLETLLRLLESDQIDFGLSEIDAALATLLARFTVCELNEQIRDLFSSDPALSQAKWEKASSEVYALAYFQHRELLYSLGWPPGYSDTAPFDFRACVSDQIVLGDAKPASGNGLALVRQEVETIVHRWKDERGLGAVQVSVDYRGTTTRQNDGSSAKGGNGTRALSGRSRSIHKHTKDISRSDTRPVAY